MKNLTLSEFEANCGFVVPVDVLTGGDIVRVDCGDAGAVVVLDEDSYSVLSESFRAVFAVAASVNADKKSIDIDTFLKKLSDLE